MKILEILEDITSMICEMDNREKFDSSKVLAYIKGIKVGYEINNEKNK